MPQKTIAEDITRLEGELSSLETIIKEQQAISELEEGGSQAKFGTKFTDITKLYKRRDNTQLRLDTLYRAKT